MLDELESLRQRLVDHSVYRAIGSMEDFRVFMQSHVFAVWDFMGLSTTLGDCLERGYWVAGALNRARYPRPRRSLSPIPGGFSILSSYLALRRHLAWGVRM